MTFISIVYALFLLSILGIYWTVNKQRSRLWILLIASLVFYTSLQVEYIPLLLLGTWINYRIGRAIAKTSERQPNPQTWQLVSDDWQTQFAAWERRRLIGLWGGILFNILVLAGFKYIPFIFNTLGTWFGLPAAQETATWFQQNILPPLGLSFFVFECIAYLIDVYRGSPASAQFLRFASYKLFFPKLISGPITRYHHFQRQLKTLIFPSSHDWVEGLWLIACGAFKKGVVADRLGIFVTLSFENVQRAGSGDLWLATIAYGLQLFLDFSGYVDIARGSAILLGFNLPKNFNFPYFSTSIADFWRRWHITLGDWLRNYLYFPLGGSRVGLGRTCLNLILVMLIAGIWHGAAWGFILWGAVHGIALAVHRLTDILSKRVEGLKLLWKSIPGTLFSWFLTQTFVFLAWIPFRLPNLKEAGWVMQHFWGHTGDIQFTEKVYLESLGLQRIEVTLLLVLIWLIMTLSYAMNRGLKLQLNWPIKIALVPLCLYAVWIFAPEGGLPYIYFDF
ncbi:MBOAT family protein [Laspinema sp. D1]|uniref:MBOAT family protein n=1 Tax=Laspinema palackyanum D2a TaxID=2953684 RepID=A0ABT2MML5_9CYAN|nr:MBOAT family protein [Laspinema sp. D2a]